MVIRPDSGDPVTQVIKVPPHSNMTPNKKIHNKRHAQIHHTTLHVTKGTKVPHSPHHTPQLHVQTSNTNANIKHAQQTTCNHTPHNTARDPRNAVTRFPT